jgi:hypothetical protein
MPFYGSATDLQLVRDLLIGSVARLAPLPYVVQDGISLRHDRRRDRIQPLGMTGDSFRQMRSYRVPLRILRRTFLFSFGTLRTNPTDNLLPDFKVRNGNYAEDHDGDHRESNCGAPVNTTCRPQVIRDDKQWKPKDSGDCAP